MRKPKWWDRPITWGDSCKWSLIGAGIGLASWGLFMGGLKLIEKSCKGNERKEPEDLSYLG